MSKESLAFVLVGHVDHGKSTLIGRLLHDTDSLPEGKMEEIEAAAEAEGREVEFGYIVDHLSEERRRGITIDTAQTFFSGTDRDYVIIDAPGHKEFIKNMITGASQAEAAVLICSAAEGVQEQTKRHAYVIKLLGLDQVLVAYNKMDLVGYGRDRFLQVKEEMNRFLRRIDITPSLEVPVSAREGDNVADRSENMEWYQGPTVLEALQTFQKIEAPTEKALRFPVQDVYELDGRHIVAGRVESGVLRREQSLHFMPGDAVRTVRQITQFGRPDRPRAEAGECIGVVFAEDGLTRGQVGCPRGEPLELTDRFHCSVFWLAPAPLSTDGDPPLTFKCATQEVPCRVAALRERIDSSTLEHLPREGRLEETEVGELVLETERPVVVESFYDVQELGRFVLVRGHEVVAGGIVTETGA
ncbi:MAG: GTP-binding protein [Planctomycetota bacterium]